MWVFLSMTEVQPPSYQHPDTKSRISKHEPWTRNQLCCLVPSVKSHSAVHGSHKMHHGVLLQSTLEITDKPFLRKWDGEYQLGFLQVQAPCCSLFSSLPWDISSTQKPSCPHVFLTTMCKTGLCYWHKGQNKTVAMKIHVIADLYLPFPQQKNWFGNSTQHLTYFRDIYLSFKFD